VSLRHFNAVGAWPDGSIGEDWTITINLVPLLMKAALEYLEGGGETTVLNPGSGVGVEIDAPGRCTAIEAGRDARGDRCQEGRRPAPYQVGS